MMSLAKAVGAWRNANKVAASRVRRLGMAMGLADVSPKIWRGMTARVVLALGLALPVPALADATPVAVELVLALDASASMDRAEFDLQVKGLAAAFRDPGVLEALKNLGQAGAAVAVTQWGSADEAKVIIPFTRLSSARDAKAFGFRISRARRAFMASDTSIAMAISHGTQLLDENSYHGDRRVIDVSGDGVDNGGLDLNEARDLAANSGIVVNGLPIDADGVGLTDYYKNSVIIGVDAFVEPATDFSDYARAIREKLIRELRPLGS